MGTIMDLTKSSSHDYVDNPFWSVFQIRVKKLMQEQNQAAIGDEDVGKVLLFVNLTAEEKQRPETLKELQKLNLLAQKYQPDGFAVYGTFTYDVQGGDDLSSKDIAVVLQKWGYLTPENVQQNVRFTSKMDVNGKEMHNLYRFLKRQSSLFVHRYGRSRRINEYYSKFLTDRYGEVKKYYAPQTEYAVIEADIKRLLEEKFYEAKYRQLLDPPDLFI